MKCLPCTRCVAYINSFNAHSSSARQWLLLSSFYKQRHWGGTRLGNLPETPQPLYYRDGSFCSGSAILELILCTSTLSWLSIYGENKALLTSFVEVEMAIQ